MNLVIDETVEETKDGSKKNIGMVVGDSWSKVAVDLYYTKFFYRLSEGTQSLCWKH